MLSMKCEAGAVRRSRAFEEEYWSSDGVEPVIIYTESDEEEDFYLNSDDSHADI